MHPLVTGRALPIILFLGPSSQMKFIGRIYRCYKQEIFRGLKTNAHAKWKELWFVSDSLNVTLDLTLQDQPCGTYFTPSYE